MKLRPVLIASAIYLGLVGLGVMFAPRYFGIGAVPVWGVFSGDARQLAKAFLVVHLLFTLAFAMAWRAMMRQTAGGHP